MPINPDTIMIKLKTATYLTLMAVLQFRMFSAEINVPSDLPTIADAINLSVDGDVIKLADGVYNEGSLVVNKSIEIVGQSRLGTIITGTAISFGWDVPSGIEWSWYPLTPAPYQAFRKLSLTDGSLGVYYSNPEINDVEFVRSNILFSGSNSANLQNCTIRDYAGGSRSLLELSGSKSNIRNVIISNNAAGRIFHVGEAVGRIENVVFEGNTGNSVIEQWSNSSYSDPSWISQVPGMLEEPNTMRYKNLVIRNNSTLSGLISNGRYQRAHFEGLEITKNTHGRGGFYLGGGEDSFIIIDKSTIADNINSNIRDNSLFGAINLDLDINWSGAPRYGFYPSRIIISNTIMWNNGGLKELNGPGEDNCLDCDYEMISGKDVRHCLIEGGYFSDPATDLQLDTPGVAIIDSDPLFADPATGDYSLRSGSPAINSGDPATPLDEDGSVSDIGAYPFLSFAPIYSTSGFKPPLNGDSVTVNGNRVLPLKVEIFDESGNVVDQLTAPPKIKISYTETSSSPVDVSDTALPQGVGLTGGHFEFHNGIWHFNLETKPFSDSGEYSIEIISGDNSEYKLETTVAKFIRL